LTHVIKFIGTSSLFMELKETNYFWTCNLINKLLLPCWTNFSLVKLMLGLVLIKCFAIKPLLVWNGSLTSRLPKWIVSTNSSFNKLLE
jgi:hypothetical protein